MPRSRPAPKACDQRFVYVDLDALLASVHSHVLSNEAQYHTELARFSSDVALAPDKLTVLLNDQQPARVQCWRGTYCANPNLSEAKALESVHGDGGQTVDWKLTQKGTPDHPTLEKMLKRQLAATGSTIGKKTLVLATGALSKGMKSVLDAYLKAQWQVQLVCLDSCWINSNWNVSELEGLAVKSLDKYLKRLLTGRHSAAVSRPDFERKLSSPILRPEQPSSSTSTSSSPTGSLERVSLPSGCFLDDRRANMLEQEHADIQRRKARLAELPSGKYTVGNRSRYVFMNLDNIAGAVCNSQGLHKRIEGATSGYDLRLNFRALTKRVCGPKSAVVKKLVAAYRKMPRELALPLQEFDWEINQLSHSSSGNKGIYYVLLDLLETAGSAKHKNTLVLVMGDGALGGSGFDQKEATKDLLSKFIEKHWFIEVHSWLHACNDWFLDIQEQHPYRVIVKPLDDAIHDLIYRKEDEEEVWVEPSWHDLTGRCHETAKAASPNGLRPNSPPPPPAWGTTGIPAISLFPITPLLTLEQKLEQRMKLEDERKDLLERLHKNQEALDALELETWSMQVLQQKELARVAQQESDKQLAMRMAQEEEMQLKFLQEYEKSQEEQPWSFV
ncbi:hypothetical protein PHYBOEH_006868 [Phytophthora boehmeriae]|uniref:Uncharacterized protein n=1 Tax=Phytophthora boehmeriae TaxID=109152 RepID=A0A8T1WF05_9STRA|nr:hypothetical protein PHYBOEH_006868 [Phytophthora boehmeriae]